MLSATHTLLAASPLCGAARLLSQQQTRNKSSKTVEVYRDASKNLSFDVVAVRCSSCCCCRRSSYSVFRRSANFHVHSHIRAYVWLGKMFSRPSVGSDLIGHKKEK
ncbi:LOW QUALITY PROTEIN: uncharacterized protein LOC108023956 [Drosophila biarmipes]|uniref:LOW QUALITY PROTEIN: uncharacterized protein LOC108023956 n=1 Tax=Drosophila biarmipes TaxID=125945 RepID=UPI0007E6FFA5|nr:LOW QUALITY PROTEIN: uncharacterized protein LOC108023956 [Drosophila biarmipes]